MFEIISGILSVLSFVILCYLIPTLIHLLYERFFVYKKCDKCGDFIKPKVENYCSTCGAKIEKENNHD